MGAWRSKPSVSRASPPLSELRSPPAASVLAQETRDGARGLAGVLACIQPSEAAGPRRKRLRSAPPEDGGGAKRIKDVGNGVVPDTALLDDDGQVQLAIAEPESLLFSCQPLGAASDMMLGPSGSAHGVQPMSLFKLDEAKYKIFLSHSGAQKDFVEQLCVDLERKGYLFPFFDQRHHSLPKGKDFAPLIFEAARLCRVAVIVLSEEFLCSKWPMIELATFYAAQQGARGGGGKLKLLPLFYKLSLEEVKDEGRWMPKWKEHATYDDRVDLSTWSVALKALCKSNGLDFGEVARKEVAYRDLIVKCIFQLSPPDLLFDSFESMVGCSRMCEAVSTQFVEDTTIGTKVLGIYGMAGLGKTMLAKALHDYFYREFLGKVCYVDMRNGSRARRHERMLKMLCGFDDDAMAWVDGDVEKGLMQMKAFVKREPFLFILDNITNDAHLLEIRDYLSVGFHPESRILITSSSKAILEGLLPNMELCISMPTLMVEEARALFLKHVVPTKAISELTSEEHNILGICIQKCWFASLEGGFYHPVALRALADFFSRLGKAKKNQLLVWKGFLEKEMDLVKDILKSSKDLYGILGLQFSTFDFSEKLLFLDVAIYWGNATLVGEEYPDVVVGWLCRLHDESQTIIKEKLWVLRKSGMIDFVREIGYGVGFEMEVPSLYQEFAKWYATDHNVIGLKNALGVFQLGGMNLQGDSSSWSNLIRLRISPMTPANARLIASKRTQELSNLVILQLVDCHDLTTLNLEGLHCLRDLELTNLQKLKTITLSGNPYEDKYVGMYDSLQHVRFGGLPSLVHMPNLRQCTSLHLVFLVVNFKKMRNLEGVDCLCLKVLALILVSPNQFERILNFHCLQSLEALWMDVRDEDEHVQAQWDQRRDQLGFIDNQVTFEGEGSCTKFLQKLGLLLYRSHNMVYTHSPSYSKEESSGEDEV